MRIPLGTIVLALVLGGATPLSALEEQEPGGGERLGAEEKEVEAAKKGEEEEGLINWMPGQFSANVAVYTDYSFRGVSQTGRQMALQGGIDWAHETGIFLGIWGSNTNFGDTYLEQDFYGGYAGSVGDLSYSVSSTFFFYPNDEIFNYWEFIGKLGYDFGHFSVLAGLIGSPDYFGTLGTGFYIPWGVAVPIPYNFKYFDLTVDGNAGYTHTDEIIFNDLHHYFDWNLGLVVGLPFNIKLDFRYVDTDVKDVRDAEARFVFGAKYSL
jgi:uncharacterized protein (TIGR02001 family)